MSSVEERVRSARAAQPEWAAASFAARASVMQAALRRLLDEQERVLAVLAAETGRSRHDNLMLELFPACDALNFWSRRAEGWLRDEPVRLHLLRKKRAVLTRRPLGVVGIITPWNAPFILCLNPVVQALMAGNAVVLKPSERTPRAAEAAVDLLHAAGVPPAVLQIAHGGPEAGVALVDAGVDKICFTGSSTVGREVGARCGRNLVPCTLELGGKDAMIVCADAKLERAAKAAVFGAFSNNGQLCYGIERVYVVRDVAEDFVARVLAEARAVEPGRDTGPFLRDVERDRVEAQLAEAVSKGARVLLGGRRRGERLFEPTVVVDVTHEMALMREESFGPVLPIAVVADEAEAVALANDARYGLSATLFTADEKRGAELARALRAGSVVVNDTLLSYGAYELPFGGVGDSGFGVINGPDGLRSFTRPVPIIAHRGSAVAESYWFPSTDEKAGAMEKAIHLLFGTALRHLLR